jgi:hypothetical protein
VQAPLQDLATKVAPAKNGMQGFCALYGINCNESLKSILALVAAKRKDFFSHGSRGCRPSSQTGSPVISRHVTVSGARFHQAYSGHLAQLLKATGE